MPLKSFQEHLESRLNKDEIAELESQAELEYQALKSLQDDVSKAVAEYMAKEHIGFNELVRRLGVSPTQVKKIQNGGSNLTLASIAHISAFLKRRPKLVFE